MNPTNEGTIYRARIEMESCSSSAWFDSFDNAVRWCTANRVLRWNVKPIPLPTVPL